VRGSKLTTRQLRFIDAYVKNPNGAAAARAAGYGVSGARVRACTLLANDAIQVELQARLESYRREMTKAGSFTIDPRIRAKLLDHFDGDEAAARRAVERAIKNEYR
jgi:Terminase small subunit